MRDPARIDPLLNLLRTYWQSSPDLRLAQIIVNLCRPHNAQPAPGVYYTEDHELEAELKKVMGAQLVEKATPRSRRMVFADAPSALPIVIGVLIVISFAVAALFWYSA